MTWILVLVVLVLLIAYSTREHMTAGAPTEAGAAIPQPTGAPASTGPVPNMSALSVAGTETPAMKAAAARQAAKEAKHEEQAKKALEKYKRDHPTSTKPDWVKFYNDWQDKHPLH